MLNYSVSKVVIKCKGFYTLLLFLLVEAAIPRCRMVNTVAFARDLNCPDIF